MRALVELTKIELKLFTRTFVNMFFVLGFPSMMLLIFGGIYGNQPSEIFGGRGTVDISVPAYTAMIIAVTGIMSLPLAVSGYREKKILKRYKATPMNPTDILVSQVIVNFIMTLIGMVLLLILAKLLFAVNLPTNLFSVFIAFLLSVMCIFSLGFLIASVSPGMKAASAIANIIYFPMIFLTGATLPLEVMPPIMIQISKVLPLTYSVNLLKGVWFGGSLLNFQLDIMVLILITIASIAISVSIFKWE